MKKFQMNAHSFKRIIEDTQEILFLLKSDHPRMRKYDPLRAAIDTLDLSDLNDEAVDELVSTVDLIIDAYPSLTTTLNKYYCLTCKPIQCNYCKIYAYLENYSD